MGTLTRSRPHVGALPNARETGLGGAPASPTPAPSADLVVKNPHGILAETRPTSRSLGMYIHVPFCTERCPFCSFNTAPMASGGMARYLAALHRELALLAALPWAAEVTLATVFFGGGTPSLLSSQELAGVLDTLGTRFRLAPDAEITVEANPESVSREKLADYHEAGVNRLSLGVQSLDDALLTRLGRLHSAAQAQGAFAAARAAGYANVSVDLMYGLPDLDVEVWARTVTGALDWEPDHLSAYGLTLDAGSRWGATGVGGLPAEEVVVEQYWTLARAAEDRGFEHYEISNYARAEHRSRHNQIYWQAAEYLAAGPGACGFVGDVRYANAGPVSRYCTALEADRLPLETSERLAPRQRLGERLILGLRTADGVPAAWLDERALGDWTLQQRLAGWQDRGLLRPQDERVVLTEAGFLLSDALFVELL
jgi:oxygen-independent coproporphyrinogen-3 oxidase